MAAQIQTRPLEPADQAACEQLVLDRAYRLGEETGMHEILEAVRDHEGLVAVEGGAVTGFLTYDRADPRSAQITWLAARPGGEEAKRALLVAALDAFAAAGTQLVCAIFKRPSRRSEHADAQRALLALYETHDFLPLCEIASLDEESSDAIVLGRALSAA